MLLAIWGLQDQSTLLVESCRCTRQGFPFLIDRHNFTEHIGFFGPLLQQGDFFFLQEVFIFTFQVFKQAENEVGAIESIP